MNSKNVILSLALLVAVSVSWWLVRNSFGNPVASNNNLPTRPDQFMKKAYYTRFNEMGTIETKLYSPRVIHYQENDTALLSDPELTMHSSNQQTWIITAKQGISKYGVKQVDLKDDIVIQRLILPDSKTTLTTTALTAFPKENYAQTDQPVTITEPGSTITSVGMTADLATGNIKLLSQAKGVYNPNVKHHTTLTALE